MDNAGTRATLDTGYIAKQTKTKANKKQINKNKKQNKKINNNKLKTKQKHNKSQH